MDKKYTIKFSITGNIGDPYTDVFEKTVFGKFEDKEEILQVQRIISAKISDFANFLDEVNKAEALNEINRTNILDNLDGDTTLYELREMIKRFLRV